MPRTLELFDKPRKPREWLMHVTDAGAGIVDTEQQRQLGHERIVYFACGRCGHESGWVPQQSLTWAKRGIPCPTCNQAPPATAEQSSRADRSVDALFNEMFR